jgi:hypothetical protein
VNKAVKTRSHRFSGNGDHRLSATRFAAGTSICDDICDEQIGYGVKVVDLLVQHGAKMPLVKKFPG